MTTQYLLQKTNDSGFRRFCAKILGDRGGTTNSLHNALLWDSVADAEVFRIMHGLSQFQIVLSDGTDDEEAEILAYKSKIELKVKNGK